MDDASTRYDLVELDSPVPWVITLPDGSSRRIGDYYVKEGLLHKRGKQVVWLGIIMGPPGTKAGGFALDRWTLEQVRLRVVRLDHQPSGKVYQVSTDYWRDHGQPIEFGDFGPQLALHHSRFHTFPLA